MKTGKLTVVAFLLAFISVKYAGGTFQNGIDRFLEHDLQRYSSQRMGIVTNHTGVASDGRHLVDIIHFEKKGKITAIFSPEHGFRGDVAAGSKVGDMVDPKTGLKVYSLYGKTRKPTKEMLKNIDLMIFSVRDVGVRYYTYISTLYYIVQACGEAGIPVLVLDQPNILGGNYVDGPIVDESLFSFIGITALPMAHGMTIGELALFFRDDIKNRFGTDCKVDVVQMEGYHRETSFSETGLKWINPSPNLRSELACLVYPGTCLLENTNVSEGRGSAEPFLIFGAPFIKNKTLKAAIEGFPGVTSVETIEYNPKSSSAVTNPKYEGKKCYGVKITGVNSTFEPVKFGFWLIEYLAKEYPGKFEIKDSGFNLMTGKKSVKPNLLKYGWKNLVSSYQKELEEFKIVREKFLLYTNSR
ncbi:MAG: DUF1343 domain-containing protein [Ignavibacteriales bacterium]|nr:DUF1343 domain-containing protein [Ignavibacteria bacterium]MBZ0197421.1 DUF1343 domain-containing protein [Ignavibacteriaceae bacterium]MCZ2144378.1 DUF1343 domain-containing protein [Ignavibacteriales bacterium]